MNRRRKPRSAALWAAACLLANAGSAQAQLQLQPDLNGLTPAEAAAAQQLLDGAMRRLPPAIRALDRRIDVFWRDLPAQVHGRARSHRILLDRDLLDAWIARPAGGGDGDPATRAALAAAIHELAHVYDRSAQGRVSRDPRLLDLAGWQVSPIRLGLRGSRNAFSDRSPDPYELHSPAEFVAVNLEHFLLDADYACRRPDLYRYFAERFSTTPPSAACAPGLPFLQADANGEPLQALDPERVYAVDYLFAEGNAQAMSRWGHSMLRLVVCAPDRPPGPDCRLDLQYHRVLSFRAFVDDVQISSWRGLTGSYPSRLFVLPLDQVVDEYTKVELRGLRSLPLRLRRDEVAALLERAARLHWSYDGRYYFLGNNCAVETFKLLHDGVPRLAGAGLASITPTGLLKRLQRARIADASVMDDANQARRLGYYFEPMNARYEAMYAVARQSLRLPQADAQAWLDSMPSERRPWLQRADLRASAALLLLEEASLRRLELAARDELKRRFLNGRSVPESEPAVAGLQDLLRLEGMLSRPAALVPGGYGLPQAQERETLAQASAGYASEWRRRGKDLRAEARRWLPPSQQQALSDAEAHIELLGERLRRLHREQGGLSLECAFVGAASAASSFFQIATSRRFQRKARGGGRSCKSKSSPKAAEAMIVIVGRTAAPGRNRDAAYPTRLADPAHRSRRHPRCRHLLRLLQFRDARAGAAAGRTRHRRDAIDQRDRAQPAVPGPVRGHRARLRDPRRLRRMALGTARQRAARFRRLELSHR